MLLRLALAITLLPGLALAQNVTPGGLPPGSVSSIAGAQSRVSINGVDQRLPPMQTEFLSQEIGRAAGQLSRAVSMLTLERQDKDEALKQAKALHERVAELMKKCADDPWRPQRRWLGGADPCKDAKAEPAPPAPSE